MTGEGYFDIQRNEQQAFKVATDHADILVLGTSFNVKALAGSPITEVSVNSGKVELSSKDKAQKVILRKEEGASYNLSTQEIQALQGLPTNALAWKTNQLSFRNTLMKDVLSTLAEHFEVSFEVENTALYDCPYSMSPSKADLALILNNLALIFEVTIEEIAPKNTLSKAVIAKYMANCQLSFTKMAT